MSPARMCLPIMDSPVTRRANVFRVGLNPMLDTSTDTQPSASAPCLGETGRNGAEQWNIHDAAAELLQRRGDPQGTGLAGIRFNKAFALERRQMNGRRPVAGKTEALRDFPKRRG